jgi:predicted TIM-barrel fold metal-dependent hydrolase
MPFVGIRDHALPYIDRNFELIRVGYRIYNRWLSDFVSFAPARLVGLAYVPMWEVHLAIEEVEWAAEAGLRGINFPAPRGGIEEYDDPIWEPFWSACDDRGMQLATHVGVPRVRRSGPQHEPIRQLEDSGWPSRRGMHRLIFGGVFERHPGVNLILTEQVRGWWSYTMRELDFAYGVPSKELRAQVPRKPSEYMTSNVFLGSSFMGPATAEEAVREGYESNVVWGSDYPHGEGTYKYPEYAGEESMTRQCLRWAFADCPPEATRAMLQDNGIRAYNLDRDALSEVAARICPTMGEIATPLEVFPKGWHGDLFGQ